jgi:hypothetical protein
MNFPKRQWVTDTRYCINQGKSLLPRMKFLVKAPFLKKAFISMIFTSCKGNRQGVGALIAQALPLDGLKKRVFSAGYFKKFIYGVFGPVVAKSYSVS